MKLILLSMRLMDRDEQVMNIGMALNLASMDEVNNE